MSLFWARRGGGKQRPTVVVPTSGGGTPVPSARPKIGVYKNFQNIGTNADGSVPAGVVASTQTVLGYENWLGRRVDYVLEYQETHSTDDKLAWPDYMQAYYSSARLGGRSVALGAGLSSRTTADGYTRAYTWQQLADGAYDTGGAAGPVWPNQGQRLVASGQAGAVNRAAHEFNTQDFAHRVLDGEQPAFILAWRRWHDALRAAGFTGPFHWNPVGGDSGGISYDAMTTAWPGDGYVDVVDLDWYDRWYPRGATAAAPRTLAEQQAKWSDHLNGTASYPGLKQWRAFAVAHGKGLAFSEWGLGDYFNAADGNHGGGDNAVYVNGMADFILDPAYPPGAPGGVTYHAFWEKDPASGVQPNSPGNPDSGRAIPVPNARQAFLTRFGGP